MRWLIALLILCTLSCGALALTSGEEEALSSLLANFPALADSSPPWTYPISSACGGPSEPSFYGITCSNGEDAHVLRLELNIIELRGSVPSEISGLQWLQVFSIENGCVSRALPSEIGQLFNLTDLALSDAADDACSAYQRNATTIPDDIAHLSKLQSLSLSLQTLSGSFPSNIGSLASLVHLRICIPNDVPLDSGFEGDIPTSLYDLELLKTLFLVNTKLATFLGPTGPVLPNLEEFSLAGSRKLYGGAQPILRSSKKLKTIDFSNTAFIDDFAPLNDLPLLTDVKIDNSANIRWDLQPSFWSTHPELVHLSAKNAASVKGYISDEIGQMRKLTHLNLESTRVNGTLPSTICLCPLKHLNIAKSLMRPIIPDNIGQLAPTLTHLYMYGLEGSGTIPESIGLLKKLRAIDLSSSSLNGTIPHSFAQLPNLYEVILSTNAFNGSLPDLTSAQPNIVDLRSNHFNGTVPQGLANATKFLYLSNNGLGPTVPQNLFVGNKKLNFIDLSRNEFTGPLPLFNTAFPPETIDMSYNQFSGTVPASYAASKALQLSHNWLSGPLDELFGANPNHLVVVYLERNLFEGSFPDLNKLTDLRVLAISNNRFSGTFPLLPPNLEAFALNDNRFSGDGISDWANFLRNSTVKYLDMSSNDLFSYVPYTSLIGPELTYLSVANNRFVSDGLLPTITSTALTGLDLSNATQQGSFPASLFPSIIVLKLAQNAFSGDFDIARLQSLTQLDLSENHFRFDVARFSALPLLTNIQARSNELFGSLVLYNLPSLQSADFSANQLDYAPDFNAIGTLFAKSRLQRLNISDNARIPKIDNLHALTTGLGRSSLSSPSKHFSDSVTCYELIFHNKTSVSFVFDEDLFNYAQCDCNNDHFGSPPFNCLKCPSDGVKSCKGTELQVEPNSYTIMLRNASSNASTTAHETSTFTQQLSYIFQGGISSFFNFGASSSISTSDTTNLGRIQLETESCLAKTVQVLSQSSNCGGLNLTAADLATPGVSVAKLLEPQCNNGSEGRLCSKCLCDPAGHGICWFEKGATCAQCRRVFRLSSSLPLALGLLILLVIILSFVMTIILRRKRVQNLQSLADLSILKRIFYRLQYLTTLGNVSIMITFLQILLAFTQWDAYAKVEIFGVINGATGSLGVQCIFPLLSDPMWALLAQLSLPFLAVGIVALSIGIGSVISRIIDLKKKPSKQARDLLSDGEEAVHLVAKAQSLAVNFPATALLTSLSITVVKFLYFGTALAAHEYLFSVPQAATGIHYLQSKPWMRYSDAWSLILASIPAILIFDLAIPLVFVIICWKVRNSFKLHAVQIYFGSLFETYHPRCFWWEIVNTLKKLSIALVLKAIPAADPIQSALVVSILSGILLIQVTMSPWRRKMENFADTASSLLLIAALIFTRPISAPHLSGVLWYIFALSIAFVISSLGTIAWQTWHGVTEYEKQQQRVLANFELNTQGEHNHGLSAEDWGLSSESDQPRLSGEDLLD